MNNRQATFKQYAIAEANLVAKVGWKCSAIHVEADT